MKKHILVFMLLLQLFTGGISSTEAAKWVKYDQNDYHVSYVDIDSIRIGKNNGEIYFISLQVNIYSRDLFINNIDRKSNSFLVNHIYYVLYRHPFYTKPTKQSSTNSEILSSIKVGSPYHKEISLVYNYINKHQRELKYTTNYNIGKIPNKYWMDYWDEDIKRNIFNNLYK